MKSLYEEFIPRRTGNRMVYPILPLDSVSAVPWGRPSSEKPIDCYSIIDDRTFPVTPLCCRKARMLSDLSVRAQKCVFWDTIEPPMLHPARSHVV